MSPAPGQVEEPYSHQAEAVPEVFSCRKPGRMNPENEGGGKHHEGENYHGIVKHDQRPTCKAARHMAGRELIQL